MKRPLKGLRHLSLSLYYNTKKGRDSLDLTCKDEYEFDFIVAGLKALVYKARGQGISKFELMKHSRIFKKYMDSGVPSEGIKHCLSFSQEYLEKSSMDQCVKRKKLSKEELRSSLDTFWEKIREFKGALEQGALNTETDGDAEGGYQHLEKGIGLGYIKVDQSERIADDKLMQNSLLGHLVHSVSYLFN